MTQCENLKKMLIDGCYCMSFQNKKFQTLKVVSGLSYPLSFFQHVFNVKDVSKLKKALLNINSGLDS